MTLTTITLLAAHLTDENHEALLDAARHRSRRDVERLIASLVPQPDIASSLRRLPALAVPPEASLLPGSAPACAGGKEAVPHSRAQGESQPAVAAPGEPGEQPVVRPPAQPRAVVVPVTSDRYLLRVTLNEEARRKLDRARDLLRHTVPSGDPAAIVERALTVLVEQLERSKCAVARRPRRAPSAVNTGRHVPASVRRAVWQRDEGRCAFVGRDGRCPETGWLELHHVVPFARGGPTTVDNLELRCRAHNAYEAEQEFGETVTRAQQMQTRWRSASRAPDSVRTELGADARSPDLAQQLCQESVLPGVTLSGRR